jgi:hypothetical protein
MNAVQSSLRNFNLTSANPGWQNVKTPSKGYKINESRRPAITGETQLDRNKGAIL